MDNSSSKDYVIGRREMRAYRGKVSERRQTVVSAERGEGCSCRGEEW